MTTPKSFITAAAVAAATIIVGYMQPPSDPATQAAPIATPSISVPVVVGAAPEELEAIAWITDETKANPNTPNWIHHWADNCGPCRMEETFFTHPEVVRLSKSYNCYSVKEDMRTFGAVPQDEFTSPASYGKKITKNFIGQPANAMALAKRMHSSWEPVMQKSVLSKKGPLRSLFSSVPCDAQAGQMTDVELTDCTVRIDVPNWSKKLNCKVDDCGSGVVINHNGRHAIVTNHHVIEDGKNGYYASRRGGRWVAVKLLLDDPEDDLAFLSEGQPGLACDVADFFEGDSYRLAGYADKGQLHIHVLQLREAFNGWQVFSGAGCHGDSGGGIFNHEGNAVGVVWGGIPSNQLDARYRNTSWACVGPRFQNALRRLP